MSFEAIHNSVAGYYSGKLAEHGPGPQGVDWNSAESQELRFTQLLKICDGAPASLNDYGCGYGALLDHLSARGWRPAYRGLDLSEEMVATARERHGGDGVSFTTRPADMEPAEVTVASGIFNVKLDASDDDWGAYVLHTIGELARLSTVGFAFNLLTSYSDADRMVRRLYYGDPLFFFDHCKRNISRNVALLHDYGLWEWTMLVRL